VLRDPAEVGEGERRAPDHHHQDHRDQCAGQDQHLAVRQLVVEPEGENADDRGAGEPDRHALQHGPGAVLQLQVLQEEDDLEPLAVDGGEAEGDQPDHRGEAGLGEELLPAAVMAADPVRPVDAVDEPVEDHQEDHDRDESRDRLELGPERGGGIEHSLHDEPGDDGGAERERGAERHRAPLLLVRAQEAGRHRGEDQDRLEPLPEDDHPAVEDRGAVAHRLLSRVGGAGVCGRHQVDQAGHHGEAGQPPGEAGVVARVLRSHD
jgi:hypothetical protein